jgi:hypothetical protein
MKRAMTVFALLIGGIATELAYPAQCLLIGPSRVQMMKRQRQRSIDGNH